MDLLSQERKIKKPNYFLFCNRKFGITKILQLRMIKSKNKVKIKKIQFAELSYYLNTMAYRTLFFKLFLLSSTNLHKKFQLHINLHQSYFAVHFSRKMLKKACFSYLKYYQFLLRRKSLCVAAHSLRNTAIEVFKNLSTQFFHFPSKLTQMNLKKGAKSSNLLLLFNSLFYVCRYKSANSNLHHFPDS
jgi:hypothetical protein